MADLKQLYYDLNPEDAAPAAGQYLVSIGRRGINSIWHIAGVRKVQHKKVLEHQRYYLSVVPAQELKPLTVFDESTNQVWVRGEAAHPLCWYPR